MDFSVIEKYEYKSPSYELKDRSYPIDPKFAAESRYVLDESTGVYRSKAKNKNEVTVLISGDLLCQENMLNKYRTKEGFDFSLCFEFVRPLLKSADLAVGNLETPISHTAPYRGEIITHEGPYYCNAPLRYLEDLAWAGFDMLYTANNHTLDAGARGLMETIDNTRRFGMIQTGTFAEKCDKYVIIDVCGFKIGFVSFATRYNDMDDNLTQEGKDTLLNTYSDELAQTLYDEMREKGAEYIVALPHWGKEYTRTLTKAQLAAAKAMTAMGYDLVAGCHAHVIQRAKVINDKPVLYSMGNLISHLNAKASVKEAAAHTVLYSLKLKRVDGKAVPEVGVIPCKILKDKGGIPFTVVPVADMDMPPVLKSAAAEAGFTVRELLESDVLPVITNFRPTEQAVALYKKSSAQLSARKAALLPYTAPKNPKAEAVLDTVSDRGGIYLIYRDHAELVQLNTPAGSGTFSPPDKVSGKPVTVYSAYSKGNKHTKLLYLPSSVEVIGPGVFRNFTGLESMRSFRGLKTVSMGAFENCSSMTGLIFADSLETIGDYAFRGCGKLMSVKLPSSVSYIADNAFEGCDKLTIYCEKDSYADSFAGAHNIPVKYMAFEKAAEAAVAENIDIPDSTPAPVVTAAEKEPKETVKFAPFAGPAVVHEGLAEAEELRKQFPPVKLGPFNGPKDKHPKPILDTCEFLGHPLPEDAVCGHQPSFYLGKELFDGSQESIEAILGKKKPKLSKAKWDEMYVRFRRKYQSQEGLDRNPVDFTVYFVDHCLHAHPKGFLYADYFDFELYNKEPEVRSTFLDDEFRLYIYRSCVGKESRSLFKNKPDFNTKYADFIHRDWVDVSTCGFEAFQEFARKHDRFFIKPLNLFGGQGTRVVETASDTIENLYEELKNEVVLAEELIIQHDDLAAINADTLNTVRVLTFLDLNNVPHALIAMCRFGRKGNVVDNFHGGGVGAIIDVETGVVISEALDSAHFRSPVHPDSKMPILGMKYPCWEKVKETALKAAMVSTDIRSTGWDLAVTKNGDVEIVEGNSRSGFAIFQIGDQTGRKHLYDPYLADIEKLAEEKLVKPPRGSAKKAAAKKPNPNAPKFAGPAIVVENEAELNELREKLPKVKMGPMNGPEDKHPQPIIEICRLLGHPLPEDAVCGHEPSFYLGDVFDGRRTPIIKKLGENMPELEPEILKASHKEFHRRYQRQGCLDRNGTNFTVYFTDWLLNEREKGVSESDYFQYEFYNKETDIRDTFINEEYRLHIYKVCAARGVRDVFKYKPTFNKHFADYIKRDWLDTTTNCSFEDFKAFAERHNVFFAKQLGRCSGIGAHVIDISTDSLENLWQHCQDEQLLLEEIIRQHEELAQFNADTLNTLRVITMVDAEGVPHIIHAVARFGRNGRVVDNFHGGGMACILDVETGTIISEGINAQHIRTPVHPDSSKAFLGFKYPKWEEIKETALKAAMLAPEVHHVGWDFAVREDGQVEIVEGNSRSSGDLLQSPDQVGRKFLYEKFVEDLEAAEAARKEAERKARAEAKAAAAEAARLAAAEAARKKNSFPNRVKRKLKRIIKKVYNPR